MDAQDLQISGRDMATVLEICGYSMTAFARYIRRPHTFVVRNLQQATARIPQIYVDALVQFVTQENFDEGLRRVRGELPQKFLRGKEMKTMLVEAGILTREFAEYVGTSYSCVYDLYSVQQVPLRFIDKLMLFVGKDTYTILLQRVRMP